MSSRVVSAFLVVGVIERVSAQHYCWPCAAQHGVVGKDTHAATDAPKCYDFFFKYLNNPLPAMQNTGNGFQEFNNPLLGKVYEAWDVPPNVFGAEVNECGTLAGNAKTGTIGGMTPADKALVEKNLRLPTGPLHECPCAVTGRAHIINGTVDSVYNWSAVESAWGKAYTEKAKAAVAHNAKELSMAVDKVEAAYAGMGKIFGVHSVYCPFHASGPCKLENVERGVARAWSGNFSQGYVPLMDNNMLFWVDSLDFLLEALLRDHVEFYPMVWTVPASSLEPAHNVYSVLVSPCGKQLVEVAATKVGDRPRELFNEMTIPRVVFEDWNKPSSLQPVQPLRMSRAVPASRFQDMLDFYGVGNRPTDAANLGFGHAKVLADVTDENGARAVTIMLSPLATVHLQLWMRPEAEPVDSPAFPSRHDFEAAAASNQINGGQPADSQEFCARGTWTVSRYSEYILGVHETVMSPVPSTDSDDLKPPVGSIMDVFLDDHFAWDCSDPDQCDMVRGGRALANFGSRTQWVNTHGLGGNWTPYSYDPVGYGIQLHWYFASEGFAPQGPIYPECFGAYDGNGTCPRAFVPTSSPSNHIRNVIV